jgi:hypothetical protein
MKRHEDGSVTLTQSEARGYALLSNTLLRLLPPLNEVMDILDAHEEILQRDEEIMDEVKKSLKGRIN